MKLFTFLLEVTYIWCRLFVHQCNFNLVVYSSLSMSATEPWPLGFFVLNFKLDCQKNIVENLKKK